MKPLLILIAMLVAAGPAGAAKAHEKPVQKSSPRKIIRQPRRVQPRKEVRRLHSRRGRTLPDAVWPGPPEIWKAPARHSSAGA